MPPNKSPLRYPGGKTRAIQILDAHLQKHFPGRKTILSPFLGGGSFELYLQAKGYTIRANDLFTPLYTFWKILAERPQALEAAVKEHCPVSKELFQDLRKSILQLDDELDVATAYYIVNRCSFSGATFCGGFSQEASTGRLNESALKTLLKVDMTNITLSNMDCLEFLDENPETPDSIVYADPPYYISTYVYGKDGDMHEAFNHVEFAKKIKARGNWILCYNDCATIRELYKDCRIIKVAWAYGMNAKKESSEVLILPATR